MRTDIHPMSSGYEVLEEKAEANAKVGTVFTISVDVGVEVTDEVARQVAMRLAYDLYRKDERMRAFEAKLYESRGQWEREEEATATITFGYDGELGGPAFAADEDFGGHSFRYKWSAANLALRNERAAAVGQAGPEVGVASFETAEEDGAEGGSGWTRTVAICAAVVVLAAIIVAYARRRKS